MPSVPTAGAGSADGMAVVDQRRRAEAGTFEVPLMVALPRTVSPS
jgi:hypothetical protein